MAGLLDIMKEVGRGMASTTPEAMKQKDALAKSLNLQFLRKAQNN